MSSHEVHIVDGTYELFRYHYAPRNKDLEKGASTGVLTSMIQLLEGGATHIGIATDQVVESFRNDLWPTYKSSAGMPPELLAQFPLVERVLEEAGFAIWPQTDYEADDGMAAGAVMAAADDAVSRVLICTPDKDLGQCVGGKVFQLDRRKEQIFDVAGVEERLGVPPKSIPDLLALVGDSADGFPGLPGWGAKSAATVLSRWQHLENIPLELEDWDVPVRGAARLSEALRAGYDDALLFRRIATVITDAPVSASVAEMRWTGPADTDSFAATCDFLGAPRLVERVQTLIDKRADK